jgi:hypothetical protein
MRPRASRSQAVQYRAVWRWARAWSRGSDRGSERGFEAEATATKPRIASSLTENRSAVASESCTPVTSGDVGKIGGLGLTAG